MFSILHEVHVQRYYCCVHCCSLTADVGDNGVVLIEGQVAEGCNWAEVCQIICCHSSAVRVEVMIEGNTTDRALVNACQHKLDTDPGIVFLLAPACSRSPACCVVAVAEASMAGRIRRGQEDFRYFALSVAGVGIDTGSLRLAVQVTQSGWLANFRLAAVDVEPLMRP